MGLHGLCGKLGNNCGNEVLLVVAGPCVPEEESRSRLALLTELPCQTNFVILSGAKRSRRTCFIACVTANRRPLQSLSPSRNEDVNRAKLSHKTVMLSEATDGTRRQSGSRAPGRSLKHVYETASRPMCSLTKRRIQKSNSQDHWRSCISNEQVCFSSSI
jgi:hypothetical protein